MTEQSYHHGDLRRALLDSARNQLESAGLEGVSVSKAAAEAGVSVAAPYRHFTDRAALLRELAAIGFDELSETLSRVPARSGTGERIVEAGLTYLHYADEHPQMFRLMFTADSRPGASPANGPRALAHLGDLVMALDDEDALSVPVDIALRLLWACVHGLAMLRIGRMALLKGLPVEAHRPDLEAALVGVTRA